MNVALLVVYLHSVAAVVCGWLFFRRFRMTRPPIGVFNLADVAAMMIAIILVPFLYLYLPTILVAALLFVGMSSLLYFTWEAMIPHKWAVWILALGMAIADVAAAWHFGPASRGFHAVNNVVLVVAVVGATNLWSQSGMKARDAALVGAALIVYDFVATSLLPMTTDLIARLAGLPFAPVVAWSTPVDGILVGIGMGDLLMATAFPLVMRKAYGRTAGLWAALLALGAIAGLFLVGRLGWLQATFPVMILLGPLMVVQYILWRRRYGVERTTVQYLEAEPL